jgi:caffeoyl-CoA O-methyltransferase
MDKFTTMTPELAAYVAAHHSASPQAGLLAALRRETLALGEISGMQISAEQGTFLSLLVAATGASHIVEVGTFTGYSAFCMAAALPPGGRLWCFDQNAEWTAIGQRYWQQGGLADRITLTLGDAGAQLEQWSPPVALDFAFIDADKPGYDSYYETLLPLMRPGALLAFDNMLRDGRVLAPQDENDKALHALNEKLTNDARVEAVLLPVADGIMLCRKR